MIGRKGENSLFPNLVLVTHPMAISRVALPSFRPTAVAVAVAITLAALATAQEPKDEVRMPSVVNNGLYCKDELNCICLGNVYVSRHCEGKVDIYQGGQIEFSWFTMDCDGETEVEPYHYLSLVNAESPADQGALLTIRGCPPPTHGYSSLIKQREANNGTGLVDYLPVVTLSINFTTLKTFPLTRHHFAGLLHLTTLSISCPALSNVSSDLLSGVSKETYFINIQHTSIESFPEGFFSGFDRLEYLSLGWNRLGTDRGRFLRGLHNLINLDLKYNWMEQLEDDVFLSTNKVSGLNLDGNRFTTIPLCVCGLSKLSSFSARDNQIGFIPPGCLTQLVSLQFVTLGGNRLLSLDSGTVGVNGPMPFEGSKREQIETSMLENPEMFPKSEITPFREKFVKSDGEESLLRREVLFRSRSISRFDFRDNDITSVPENTFFGLDDLWLVDLSRNKISGLPTRLFHHNGKLRELDISHNLIARVPDSLLIANGFLSFLDLSGNRIKTLDAGFFKNLTRLIRLNLSNNSIDFLPRDIFLPFNETLDSRVTSYANGLILNLEGNLLKTLPILTLPKLTGLNLSRNRLSYISVDALKYVQYLERLDLSYNFINTLEGRPSHGMGSMIPGVLFHGMLGRLSSVDLSNNQLTSFPNLQFVYTNLKSLNLSGNQIRGFASECGALSVDDKSVSAVELLNLSNNRFVRWTSKHALCGWERKLLERIKLLDLSWNKMNLTYCEERLEADRMIWGCVTDFKNLEKLEEIRLSHNEINFLPMDFLHYLPKLRLVDLSYNRIRKLWHHDFLVTNGLTEVDLMKFRLSPSDYVLRRGQSYYEFPNSHRLTIDLRHNEIRSVDLPDKKMQLVDSDCKVDSQFARATIKLGGNPFVCGCQARKLQQYSIKHVRPVSEEERRSKGKYPGNALVLPATLDIRDLRCAEPQSVAGMLISDSDSWVHNLMPRSGFCNFPTGVQRHPRKV